MGEKITSKTTFFLVGKMIRLSKISVNILLKLSNLERQLLRLKVTELYITLDVISMVDFLRTTRNRKVRR
eukprot:snap_masked-scaffold_22-processed-gene-2.25-mRNA-1 protein AED:1.00 eAED:1.00 QI:0/0/0/0/1/1/2/0/69